MIKNDKRFQFRLVCLLSCFYLVGSSLDDQIVHVNSFGFHLNGVRVIKSEVAVTVIRNKFYIKTVFL